MAGASRSRTKEVLPSWEKGRSKLAQAEPALSAAKGCLRHSKRDARFGAIGPAARAAVHPWAERLLAKDEQGLVLGSAILSFNLAKKSDTLP
jgi:hypothetical protein